MYYATRIEIDTDEQGLMLVVSGDGQTVKEINIQGIDLDAFYDQVKSRIGAHLYERDMARAEFRCSDVDESGGYALVDPKHPEYHSVRADLLGR